MTDMTAAADPAAAPGHLQRPAPAPARARTNRRRQRYPLPAVATAAAAAIALAGCSAQARGVIAPAGIPVPAHRPVTCSPPATALSPQAVQVAYQAGPLIARSGGRGVTVAIIMPYYNPWVSGDLRTYDQHYRLPAADVQEIDYMRAPVADSASADAWAHEGSLDLEMVHIMAPAARLLYLAAPDNDTVLDVDALRWLITHTSTDVLSRSYDSSEPALAAEPGLAGAADSELAAAARAGITVIAASGDFGATDAEPGTDDLYPYPAVAWPASDPLVTAVGGTRLRVTAAGTPDGPASAVSDGSDRAGGGGLSAIFPRPSYQDGVRNAVGGHRGIPDISMDAGMCSPVVMYTRAGGAGWEANGGTSVAAPLFAGIIADAVALAGHRLGPVNPVLYRLHGTGDGLADVTRGNTSTQAMRGYQAVPGYDLATGLGTVSNAALFAAALAAASPPAEPASALAAPVIA